MSDQRHGARVCWNRDAADFTGQRYSRAHEWRFDGGAVVRASASPANVPGPYSVPEAVDPEEALIAAASSCHMLWFLAIAAKRGHVVDSYIDDAVGFLGTQQSGKTGFTRITLHPNIEFARGREPTQAELASMHEEAHRNCYIANSLNCDIEVATGSSA